MGRFSAAHFYLVPYFWSKLVFMTTSRKCPECSTWNTDSDYCGNCGRLINPYLEIKQENEQREAAIKNRTKDRVDLFLEQFKQSRWWAVKALYYLLYSVWFLLFGLVSFFIYMVAAGPG